MPISTVDIGFSNIIVAYDISDSDKQKTVRDFLRETLKAIERTESVYEITYNEAIMTWDEIPKTIENMIDLRTDTVYFWYVLESEKGPQFTSTKISR